MTNIDPDDAEVETEFKRIEHERIAHERAEAEEDVSSPAAPRRPGQPLETWKLVALVAALAVGVVTAFVANRWQPRPSPAAAAPEPAR